MILHSWGAFYLTKKIWFIVIFENILFSPLQKHMVDQLWPMVAPQPGLCGTLCWREQLECFPVSLLGINKAFLILTHFSNWHYKIIWMHSTTQLAIRKHYIAPLSLIFIRSSFGVLKRISPRLYHLIKHLLEINATPVNVLCFSFWLYSSQQFRDSQSSVRFYLMRSYSQHLFMTKLSWWCNCPEKWNWIDVHHFWPSQVQNGLQEAEGRQTNKQK